MQPLLLAHGSALSNLALFVAVDTGIFAAHGLRVQAPPLAAFHSTAQLLRSGAAQLGTTGFTQALVDHELPDPLRIVGGSGTLGMALIGQAGVSMSQLHGRMVGTFADDPMEVLLYDSLQMHGVSQCEVDCVYFASISEGVDALITGRIVALTLIEPWISRLRARGFDVLCDGASAWSGVHPDTVLVARQSFLKTHPNIVCAALRALLDAQRLIEEAPHRALQACAHRYPEFTMDELQAALVMQPPLVDIRPLRTCIVERAASLEALGRMRVTPALSTVFAFEPLEDVLRETSPNAPNVDCTVQPH